MIPILLCVAMLIFALMSTQSAPTRADRTAPCAPATGPDVTTSQRC